MNRATRFVLQATAVACAVFAMSAQANVIRIDQSAFTAQAGKITFSEFASGTQNPTCAPGDHGGGAGAPTVTFGGWFTGQSAGTLAPCPPGAAVFGCVLGLPSGTLSLDAASPCTFITSDAANPSSPVLSGSSQFDGSISILFDKDLAGVGLDGGYFDAIGGTAIRAFARDGSVIGSIANLGLGIEFLGLVTNDGSARIAGLQFSLVGAARPDRRSEPVTKRARKDPFALGQWARKCRAVVQERPSRASSSRTSRTTSRSSVCTE